MSSVVSVWQRYKPLFYADLRSLAALRIGVGVVLIIDLIARAPFIAEFYADGGMVPAVPPTFIGKIQAWSLHSFSGSVEFESLLFIISFVFACMLILGYKTRTAAIASFILIVSLHHRNDLIINRGDTLLRLLVFWGIFLPWNARFSLDAFINKSLKKLPNRVFSIGILGYFAQICFLYFFAALYKSGPGWVKDYTAIFYTLSSSIVVTDLAKYVLQYPQVTKLMTIFVRIFEMSVPVLLFFPYKNSYVRMFTLAILIFMHFGFAIFMTLGLFPFIDIVALLGLLPSLFWDRIYQIFKIKEERVKRVVDRKMFDFSRTGSIVVILFIAFAFIWQVYNFHFSYLNRNFFLFTGYTLGLNQRWDMFSPEPTKYKSWHVFAGKLSNGKLVDVETGKDEISLVEPENLSQKYKNFVWRNIAIRSLTGNEFATKVYVLHLCRSWNNDHSDELASIDAQFIIEEISFANEHVKKPLLKKTLSFSCKS